MIELITNKKLALYNVYINGENATVSADNIIHKYDGEKYLGFYKYYKADMTVDTEAEFTNVEFPKALKDLNNNFESQVAALTTGVPQSEILSWTKQESEARAWKSDNSVSTPLIDSIVANRSKYTKEQLVDKIIEKADLYAQAIGNLTGVRQEQEDMLQA